MNDIDRIETEFMKKKIDRDKVSMSATDVSKMFAALRGKDAEIGRLNKQVGLYYDIDAKRTKKIQELQQENEQLKAFTPKQGECIYDVEQICQIMAQNAAMREAIKDFINKANILTGSDEKIIAEDSTYWKFKKVLSFIAADYNNPADMLELQERREDDKKQMEEIRKLRGEMNLKNEVLRLAREALMNWENDNCKPALGCPNCEPEIKKMCSNAKALAAIEEQIGGREYGI